MQNLEDQRSLRIVVLISGNGSNLQAIIDAIKNESILAEVCAVISNQADAYGLTRAKKANIPAKVLDHRDFANSESGREDFDKALQSLIDSYQPGLVVLAGFMRILSDGFVQHYMGHMVNIHPSLLPKYKGLNTHQRVLDAGETQHGASVHFVTNELDSGAVILQATVPVLPDDDADSLANRVHRVEHIVYPQAVRWFAEHRLRLKNGTVLLDGQPITDQQRLIKNTQNLFSNSVTN